MFKPTYNTMRPRQVDHHLTHYIFACIFLNENVWISINISLNFVSNGQINNIAWLVRIMAWRLPGDKPLSEPMMVSLLTDICVTRPQWVEIDSSNSIDLIYIDVCPVMRVVWILSCRNKVSILQVGCQLDEPCGFSGDHWQMQQCFNVFTEIYKVFSFSWYCSIVVFCWE